MSRAVAAGFLSLVLWFAGCARQGDEGRPSPSSGISREEARAEAIWWARKPGRTWNEVAPTGSMAGLFDSSAILRLELYTGQPLRAGDLVVFDRGDAARVVHVVRQVGEGAVLVSGESTNASDGWIPLARIKARVAGIDYVSR